LFFLALDDLRCYCEDSSKQVTFEVFRDYDLCDDDRPSYSDLAVKYGIPETTVTNYLASTRRMLRQFVMERLKGTTADAKELHQEMRRVWK